MKKLTFFLLLSGHCCIAVAQSWADTVAKIEQIFSRYNSDSTPGAELAISRHGQVIFSRAWGMADLEHNVPLTTSTLSEAGSVSKQFTAAAILLLEQQGKLSLDDDVRKHVPELPDYGKVITVRHLMQHTSGLKDWGSIMELAGWGRGSRVYSNEYALHVICQQESLNNQPGDEFIYSNSNYNLMAIIVQRVTGLTLATFTERYIFQPAGMKHTEWRANYRKVVKNRAIAYSKSGQFYYINMPNENAYGNGGLLTTAEDLLVWNDYYLSGKFGNPSLLPNQVATRKLNNGGVNNYAAGLFTDSINGWKAISHTGATAGYRAYLEYFPEAGLSIAWLSNTSAFDNDTFNLSNAVRKILLPDRRAVVNRPANTPVAAVKTTPADTSAGNMKSYAGVYYSREAEAMYDIAFKSGRLLLQVKPTSTFILTPVAKDVFRFPLGQVVFERDAQQKVTALKVSISRARNVVFRRVPPDGR